MVIFNYLVQTEEQDHPVLPQLPHIETQGQCPSASLTRRDGGSPKINRTRSVTASAPASGAFNSDLYVHLMRPCVWPWTHGRFVDRTLCVRSRRSGITVRLRQNIPPNPIPVLISLSSPRHHRDDPNIDETTRLRNRIAELESLVRELRGRPLPPTLLFVLLNVPA